MARNRPRPSPAATRPGARGSKPVAEAGPGPKPGPCSQPCSGPTDATLRGAGSSQGSASTTRASAERPRGPAPVDSRSRRSGVGNGPHRASGYARPRRRRLVQATVTSGLQPRPPFKNHVPVRLAGSYSRCSVSRPRTRGCRSATTEDVKGGQGHSSNAARRRPL